PDDRPRRDVVRLQFRQQARRRLGLNADGEAAGGLRVQQQAQAGRRGAVPDDQVLAQIGSVLAVAARDVALRRQPFRFRQGRDGGAVNFQADAAGPRQMIKMAQQPEPGHVRRRVDGLLRADADSAHRLRRARVQRRHAATGGLQRGRVAVIELGRRRDNAGAQWLSKHDYIAGPRARVRGNVVWIDQAGDGQAKLRLGVLHAVPADQHRPRLRYLFRAAAQYLRQLVRIALLDGEAEDVHDRDRPAAHRVDIRERVGRRDLPVEIRVIHDGRKEVHRLNEGEVVREAIDARVIAGRQPDEQVGICGYFQVAQNLRELGRPNLAGSPGAAHQMRQPGPLVYQFAHAASPPILSEVP